MKKQLVIFSLLLTALAASPASQKHPNVLDLKESITDDAIIFPESFETDSRKLLESWYMKNYTDTDDGYRSMPNPVTSDDEIRKRLAALPTVIDMPFNSIVREYIDRYMEKGRPLVAGMLGLSTYYMPIFEQALEAERLPLELKYLPVIESALDPNAVSRSGAGGLWQFMPAAAKGYGLEISSLVDERRDPYLSSKTAAKMLHELYDTYGDWSLAIAAYNCGPGAVNKAIRRAGGDPKSHDFWSIYSYLTPETRGYVPMFIAANYVMTYYKDHNISPVLPTRPLVTDTVGIGKRVHFDQISKVLDIPKEELRILNPQFRADIIPGSGEKQYMLILPSQQAQAYIMSEPEILAYESARYARRIDAEPGEMPEDGIPAGDVVADGNDMIIAAAHPESEEDDAPRASSVTAREEPNLAAKTRVVNHTVASGETINDIATLYNVRVSDIRSWNSLRRNAVRVGQTLHIETAVDAATIARHAPAPKSATRTASVNKDNAAAQVSASKSRTSSKSSGKTYSKTQTKKKSTVKASTSYKIKSGENLTTIARKHGVTVEQLRKANNLKGDNIRAGENLKIPSSKSYGTSRSKSKKKRR